MERKLSQAASRDGWGLPSLRPSLQPLGLKVLSLFRKNWKKHFFDYLPWAGSGLKVARVSNLVFLCIPYEFCATFMPKQTSNMVFSLSHGPDVSSAKKGQDPLFPVLSRMLADCSSQELWLPGLAAPWHVGSSQTRDQNQASCTGRQTLYY